MTKEEEFELARLQLQDAFFVANIWHEDKRRNDPLGGFNRGWEWGEDVLKAFMPSWFEEWFRHSRWHTALLLGDMKDFENVAEAFGYEPVERWYHLMELFVPAYLTYHKVTLNSCEKPSVTEFFKREPQHRATVVGQRDTLAPVQ